MDHLPIPERLRGQVPSVPWLRHAPPYDRKGFEGFPERIGMSEDVIMAAISAEWPEDGMVEEAPMIAGVPHRDYIESVLQEWLWFGLMHEFELACGVEKDDADGSFTFMRDGKLVLDTTPLMAYVRKVLIVELLNSTPSWDQERIKKMPSTMLMVEWENARLEESTSEQFQMKYAQTTAGMARCLQRVRDITRIVLSQNSPILRFEIAVSIDLLCSTIHYLINELWSQLIHLEPRSPFYKNRFERKMLSQNWCPARINSLFYQDLPCQYIFSLHPSSAKVSHTSCDSRACRQRPKDPGNMKPSHRTSDCECEMISFDETALIRVLQLGGNPGILKVWSQNGTVSYEIVDVRGCDFIAISHVFSQGMGNSKANALPRCQIEKLWEFIEELEPRSSALWIDTISVPMSDEWKRLAISKLREVYTTAAKVLVVDRDLSEVGDHWLERRFQVLASEWMRRLWTLQEGRLAKQLYFQFKDGAVPVDRLMVMDASSNFNFKSCLSNCLVATTQLLYKHFGVEESGSQTFLNIIEDLSNRSVTYPSDEPICIATLLGLKLENFHPYPNIIDIYRSVKNIPQNIIFVRTPRLKIDGFRWAPATFLEKGRTVFPLDLEPPAKLTPRGLEVTKSCIFITGEFRFEYNLFATIYLVSCSLEGELVQFKLANFGFGNEQVRTINNAAIILDNTSDGLTYSFGILVSLIDMQRNDSSFVGPVSPLITGNQKDTRYSRFQMYMDVWRIIPATRPELERRMATPGHETCHLSGKLVSNVKICVD